jgi:hypothetical protein
MGQKFAGKVAGGIEPGDVILIARRFGGAPEMVGFGVVDGEAKTTLRGFKPPDDFGSLRRLRPFIPWSRPPTDVPLAQAVRHTRALAQLHPNSNEAHREICDWIERHIERAPTSGSHEADGAIRRANGIRSTRDDAPEPREVAIVSAPENYQLDYEVRSKAEVRRAQKREARLLESYEEWLKEQNRKLDSVKMGALQCDGYEKARRNLIEAKSSATREHIRMAVGQLLDYAFQGKSEFAEPHMAVLLPEKPPKDVEAWLHSVGIKLIWPDGNSFLDNANGQFT